MLRKSCGVLFPVASLLVAELIRLEFAMDANFTTYASGIEPAMAPPRRSRPTMPRHT